MKFFIVAAMFFLTAALWANNINFENLSLEKIRDTKINMENLNPQKDSKPGNCNTPVEVNAEEAYEFIMAKKPILIDIRTLQEYEAGHIENTAMNIDFYAGDFKEQLSKLDKDGKYLIYCRSGRRTGLALEMMKEMGFSDIHHIKGGIIAWQDAGYLLVK